ncbi:MAG: DUF58 domain-containing protein [Halovenus sp.]
MSRAGLYLLVGAACFGLAIVELVQPGTILSPRGDTGLRIFGGIVALYALSVFRKRQRDRAVEETPEVELAEPTAVPGETLADALRGFPGTEGAWGQVFSTERRGLRAAATTVLTRYEDTDEEAARERVEDGSWSDDPYAAGYLSTGDGTPRSLRDRFDRLRSGNRYRSRLVRRTVDALAGIANVSTEPREPHGEGPDGELDGDTLDDVESTTVDGPRPDGTTVGAPRETNHLAGVSAVALVCLGVGLVALEPGVLLASIVGVGYAAYSRFASPGPAELVAERTVSEAEPEPGETVQVTLTVTNEGGRFRPDVRIVDGVPERLAVIDGSPRLGTALRPGESVTLSYTVTVKRGEHEFGPALALTRNLAGTNEQELFLEAETTVRSILSPAPLSVSVPLRKRATQHAGRVGTDTGGEGLEFHAVREYQPGDAMSRVDWNRRARTGELATLEFRQERAVRAVVVVDARPDAYVGHSPVAEHAVDRSVDAAYRVFARLLDDGHQAGLATFGRGDCWLAPGASTNHRQRGRELLAANESLQSGHTTGSPRTTRWIRRLRGRLPENTQLIVLSPLVDAGALRLVRSFEARGHPVTVISPDPTRTGTASHRLMAVRRAVIVTVLRQAGVPVIDWQPVESLDAAVKKGTEAMR